MPQENVDVLVLTALTEEQQVVHSILERCSVRAERHDIVPNGLTFYEYRINTGESYLLATASMHDMGAVAMTEFATSIFNNGVRPCCAVLVGIAATLVRDDIGLGDVPVASEVFAADDIKVEDGKHTFRPHGFQVDPRIRRTAGDIRANGTLHREWRKRCKTVVAQVVADLSVDGLRSQSILIPDDVALPRLVIEAGVGGPFLIADVEFGKALVKGSETVLPISSKLAWAEMEAHGFMKAAHTHQVPAIVMKGISDAGDADKASLEKRTGGFFRAYACSNSVVALLCILDQRPLPPLVRTGRPSATTPRYENDEVRILSHRLQNAFARRRDLQRAGADSHSVDREILELRSQLRRGGQLRAGDTLEHDRYLLLRLLGKGGFATVWEARERLESENGGPLERNVALKILHGDQARDPIKRERFFRGARVMSELHHPSVVPILAPHGEDDGYCYFAMALIVGEDLQQAVLGGRLRIDSVVPLVLEIGNALTAAHDLKVVHRDVKPSNILLDSAGRPFLTDFDLVLTGDTTGGTRTGPLGTFLFSSPEQLHDARTADSRSDVYALAMTLLFCLHGGSLPQETVRSPEVVVAALPCDPATKALLIQSLELDRSKRPNDARAFCQALRDGVTSAAEAKLDSAQSARSEQLYGMRLQISRSSHTHVDDSAVPVLAGPFKPGELKKLQRICSDRGLLALAARRVRRLFDAGRQILSTGTFEALRIPLEGVLNQIECAVVSVPDSPARFPEPEHATRVLREALSRSNSTLGRSSEELRMVELVIDAVRGGLAIAHTADRLSAARSCFSTDLSGLIEHSDIEAMTDSDVSDYFLLLRKYRVQHGIQQGFFTEILWSVPRERSIHGQKRVHSEQPPSLTAHTTAPQYFGLWNAMPEDHIKAMLGHGQIDEAIRVLMSTYGAAVLSYVRRMLNDDTLAQDVTQQVFVEAWSGLSMLESRTSLWSWLHAIATQRCADAMKRNRRKSAQGLELDSIALSVEPDSLSSLDRSRMREALQRCLGMLAEPIRAQVLMRYYQGLSYTEIAQIVGAAPSTIQVRVSRVLPVLMRCLRQSGLNAE